MAHMSCLLLKKTEIPILLTTFLLPSLQKLYYNLKRTFPFFMHAEIFNPNFMLFSCPEYTVHVHVYTPFI